MARKKSTPSSAPAGDAVSSGAADPVTTLLLEHAADIARQAAATAMFVYVDAVELAQLPFAGVSAPRVCYVTRRALGDVVAKESAVFIRVPDVPLTRMGQVKLAIFLATSRNLIQPGDRIVCLTGVAQSGALDTLVVATVGRELEMFAAAQGEAGIPGHILPEVIERVVDIASQLGHEGREGKAVGMLMVVGDADRVREMSRQLILNPFHGYPPEQRNILDPTLEETIKEFATMDGAFIVRGDGVIETCGAYLKIASKRIIELSRGLGARHHAAAAITAETDSIAVTVSESTGTVTIFRGGKIVTEIEKPRHPTPSREIASARGPARRGDT